MFAADVVAVASRRRRRRVMEHKLSWKPLYVRTVPQTRQILSAVIKCKFPSKRGFCRLKVKASKSTSKARETLRSSRVKERAKNGLNWPRRN